MLRYRDWAADLKVAFWALLLLCLAVGHCSTAEACQKCGLFNRHCKFQQQQIVVAQQAYAYPVIHQFNFVGQYLRTEAIIEKQKQSDPEWTEFQQFKRWRNKAEQPAQEPAQEPNQVPAEPYQSVLATKCASCHGGAAPKAGLLLDGTGALSDALKVRASNAVLEGRMPPESRPPLTDEEYSGALREILTFKNEGE
jgi:mono/diheme cytochrome c family protein